MSSEALDLRLKAFCLPGFLENYADMAQRAEKAGWGHVQYLEALSEIEAEERRGRRVARLLKCGSIPAGDPQPRIEKNPKLSRRAPAESTSQARHGSKAGQAALR